MLHNVKQAANSGSGWPSVVKALMKPNGRSIIALVTGSSHSRASRVSHEPTEQLFPRRTERDIN